MGLLRLAQLPMVLRPPEQGRPIGVRHQEVEPQRLAENRGAGHWPARLVVPWVPPPAESSETLMPVRPESHAESGCHSQSQLGGSGTMVRRFGAILQSFRILPIPNEYFVCHSK